MQNSMTWYVSTHSVLMKMSVDAFSSTQRIKFCWNGSKHIVQHSVTWYVSTHSVLMKMSVDAFSSTQSIKFCWNESKRIVPHSGTLSRLALWVEISIFCPWITSPFFEMSKIWVNAYVRNICFLSPLVLSNWENLAMISL